MHGKRAVDEAKACFDVGLLELFHEQAVDKTVASARELVEARIFHQETRKKGLEGFYYGRVCRGDAVVQCPVLKDPELTAGKMLRQKR